MRVKAQCPGEQLIKVTGEFRKSVASDNVHARTHNYFTDGLELRRKVSYIQY